MGNARPELRIGAPKGAPFEPTSGLRLRERGIPGGSSPSPFKFVARATRRELLRCWRISLAQFAVLLTHREVVGREPKIAELHSLLSKYQRREVIFLLAKLNAVLGTWKNEPNFQLDDAVSRIFLKGYLDQIAELKRQGRIVFSRMTLLYLVKQACIASSENGTPVNTDEAIADVGLAALMANDLMLPRLPSSGDSTLERLANLFPFSDYISTDGYATEIARGQKMFELASRLNSLRERTDFVDITQRFEELFGLSHSTFSQLIFGCATKFLGIQLNDLRSPNALLMKETFFQKTTVSLETARKFFATFALAEDGLAEKIQGAANRPGDDFTILQAFPLLLLAPELYTCFDPGFLVDKAGRNLYWTLFSALNDNEKGKLGSFWGAVFEEYVNQLLAQSYAGGGTFVPGPKFTNGDEAFDAYILERGSLIVFEHKSSIIRADAKYGGDVGKLKRDLDLKFVEGDEDGAKGIAQLNRSIARFLRGEAIGGLLPKDVYTIYPCIVCLDNAVSIPYMAAYFKEQFKAVFPRKEFRQTVTTLFTLNITDVENLLGYLGRFQLSDILESYHAASRTMLTSLSTSSVPLLEGVAPDETVLRRGFAEFARKLEEELFPQGEVNQDAGHDAL